MGAERIRNQKWVVNIIMEELPIGGVARRTIKIMVLESDRGRDSFGLLTQPYAPFAGEPSKPDMAGPTYCRPFRAVLASISVPDHIGVGF